MQAPCLPTPASGRRPVAEPPGAGTRTMKPVEHHLLATRRTCLLGLAGALTLPGCAGPGGPPPGPAAGTYGDAMRQAIRSVAGELPGYAFRASPVGRFGVGSVYLDEATGASASRAEENWFLGTPDSWAAPGRPAAERQQWLARLVMEGSLGRLSLGTSGSRELGVRAGVALVSALLGVEVGLEASQGLSTRIEAEEIRQRRLNWAEVEAARRAGRVAPAVASVMDAGSFVIAAADVVLIGYRAFITVERSASPRVTAGLHAKSLPVVPGAGVGFSVSEAASGRYMVTANQPVVAAVLYKRPPKRIGKDAAAPAIDTWPEA